MAKDLYWHKDCGDSTDHLQTLEGQEFYSNLMVTFPLPVKTDFNENFVKFDDSDSNKLYMLHFEASEQNFCVTKNRLAVHNIKIEAHLPENNTSLLRYAQITIADNSRAAQSAVTSED